MRVTVLKSGVKLECSWGRGQLGEWGSGRLRLVFTDQLGQHTRLRDFWIEDDLLVHKVLIETAHALAPLAVLLQTPLVTSASGRWSGDFGVVEARFATEKPPDSTRLVCDLVASTHTLVVTSLQARYEVRELAAPLPVHTVVEQLEQGLGLVWSQLVLAYLRKIVLPDSGATTAWERGVLLFKAWEHLSLPFPKLLPQCPNLTHQQRLQEAMNLSGAGWKELSDAVRHIQEGDAA